MTTAGKIEELIGKDLNDFKIVEMTEVYRVNVEGQKVASLGFFKSSNIASAFAAVQTEAKYYRAEQALVLLNGTVGYVIERQKPANIFDDEAMAVEIKKKVLNKLSPAERNILGLA